MAKTYQTTLLIRGDSKNAVREVSLTRQELDKLTGVQAKNATISQRMGAAFQKANKDTGKLTGGLRGLGSVLATVGFAALTRKTIASADSLANMQGQLKLVTDSQDELNQVYDRALQLSNATGQATESTVNLYARMARSTEELNLSQDKLFTITKAVNQSFVVSGAATSEASSAVLQLSQGLAAGALRGEELNSVMENSPRLARALADGLGVSIGQLRQLGSDGELTAERVTSALLSTANQIDAEFQEMPMTVGRSMQALSNLVNDALGNVDTGPLTKAVAEAQSLLADPAFMATLSSLSGALISVTTNFTSALVEGAKFAKWLGEELASRINGIAGDDIPRLESALMEAADQLAFYEKNGHGASKGMDALRKKVTDLSTQLNLAYKELRESNEAHVAGTKATAKHREAIEDLAPAIELATDQTKEYLKQQKEQADALSKSIVKNDAYVESLRFEMEQLGRTGREQTIQTALRRLDANATDDQITAVTELTGKLYDERKAQAEAAQAAKESEKSVDALTTAAQRGAERLDDTMGQFFRDMLRDGKVSFDSLKNLFTDTLAEMIYAAARNKILLSIGMGGGSGSALAALSGSAGGGSGAAGTGIGGALSGISSLYSGFKGLLGGAGASAGAGFFGGVGNLYNSAGRFLINSGQALGSQTLTNAGLQSAQTGAGYATGATSANLAQLGTTAIYGAVGGYAGTKVGESVFNRQAESAWGATAGAAIGSIWPGIGTAIGAAIGGLVDAAFGSSNSDKTAEFTNDFATGERTYTGLTGDKRKQGNEDIVTQLSDQFAAFADSIGGSDSTLAVAFGSRDGLRLDGKDYGDDIDAFLDDGFDKIIEGSERLTPALKELIREFEGSTDELTRFAASMLSLSDAINVNPVQMARDEWERLTDGATTATSVYFEQSSVLKSLITDFDGSALAAQNLNSALVTNREMAYQLATAILQTSDQIGILTTDSAQFIRQSVMSEDELRKARKEESVSLLSSLRSLSDPAEIRKVVGDLELLNKQIFQSLSPERQQETAEFYASSIEQINSIAQNRLNQALEDAEREVIDVNTQIEGILTAAATQQQSAANTMSQAVGQFGAVIAQLQSQGIRVNLTGLQEASEVNR